MITVFQCINCKTLNILILIEYHLVILVFVFNACFGQFFLKYKYIFYAEPLFFVFSL